MFNYRNHAIYFFVFWALIAAIFINLKTFLIPGCMAYDLTDDAMHTFVNLSSAQSILSEWKIPLINLLNNFGTPLIGDTLTYPFSFQSLTYWFFPFDLSMEINRFCFAFLTVLLLSLFFSKYMNKLTSVACAYMVMFDGGFIWHFVHHHYQASLFWCLIILIFQEKFTSERKFLYYLGLVLSHIFLFLNTSINIALISYIFLFFNLLYLTRFKFNRIFFLGLIAMFSGLLFSYPDISYFFSVAQESVRATQFYQEGPHYIVARRNSIILLSMALVGLVKLWKEGKGWDAARLIFLGFLPVILVSIVISEDYLWKALPLIRSTDITRFWWVSNIFLAIGMGIGIDYLCKKSTRVYSWISAIYLMVITEFCFSGRIITKASILYQHRTIIFSISLAVLILCYLFSFSKKSALSLKEDLDNKKKLHLAFISLLIIGFQLTFAFFQVFQYKNLRSCRVYHQFSSQGSDRFQPRAFLKIMRPFSRIAIDERTDLGRELKITRDNLLSSAGRSVLQDKEFTNYLKSEKLIELDHYLGNYHFSRPWEADKLSELGIRYIIQDKIDENMSKQGWITLVDGLYENPMKTSLAYLIDKNGKRFHIDGGDISLKGNEIDINLPEIKEPQELIATFVALNGWQVFIDGERKNLIKSGNKFLRAKVSPGQSFVRFEFRPFSLYVYIWSILFALLIPILTFYMFLGVRHGRYGS